MKFRPSISWLILASLAAYIVWAFVLRYGTAREKELVTAAIIVSPIPPFP